MPGCKAFPVTAKYNASNSYARSLKIQIKPYLVQIYTLVGAPKEDLNLCSQAHQEIPLSPKPQPLALLKLKSKIQV